MKKNQLIKSPKKQLKKSKTFRKKQLKKSQNFNQKSEIK